MASVSDVIKYCQHAIEKYPNDEQKILKCIDKLFHLDVTVQHLQETGIGRTVNALRKEPGDVGQAARALVYKWKVMVAAEESDQEGDHRNDTSNYNGHISERDSEDSAPKPKPRNDHYEKSAKSNKSLDDQKHKHLNGESSGNKRRYHHSEQQEPETKKSKHSSSSDDRHKRKQIQNEPSESEIEDTNNSHTDDSESETSQSSNESRKEKNKVKEDKHTSSYPSKHTSHHSHKINSTSEKISKSSERHSKHKSGMSKSEKSLSEEKCSNSHKESSSRDKENSSSKKIKSDQKSKENEKRSDESSSKHSSKKEHSSNTHKDKDYSNKHSNTSGKHKNSNEKTEKVKAKSSSSKDTSSDRHKSRESSSSKHSTSSKDKSIEKHLSSKELDDSSKTDKKQIYDNNSKYLRNEEIVKDKKDSDRKNKHSSSSSKSSKSSNRKKKDDTPKKKLHVSNSEDSEDGIDCGSGASFAEALGMISPAKPKKKSTTTRDITSPNTFTDLSPASLLAPTAKLAPLPAIEISALPEISPNYKPRPPPKVLPHFTDEDAMNHVISSKNQRTKVYSGNKVLGKIPTLYEMCVNILQEHIDALEYTGGVPYEILKPVVDKATPQQLFMLEHYNPYLMEETDHLWQKFCEKHFRNKQRKEMETWREMYMRCQEEQEHRLKSLTANIKIAQEAKKAPIKQTKMAYVDTIVKPPRNVLRKQALHGTAHASTASPAARVASLAAAPNVLRGGSVRPPPAAPVSTSSFNKPKKAPLMQKALQFFRGRKR